MGNKTNQKKKINPTDESHSSKPIKKKGGKENL
jgi:hypothetical protein